MSRSDLSIRPRRNRKTPSIRGLVQETLLSPRDFVAPFFVLPGKDRKEEINSLPGVFALSIDCLLNEIQALHRKGLQAILLFPVIPSELKDPFGREALRSEATIPNAIEKIKAEFPSICIMADVALDPYTSHGHDGVMNEEGEVLNDETVEILAKVSLIYAQAGVDFVAPSDMMDGRVGLIRRHLDQNDFKNVGIIAYTAKYASSLYGPFRNILGSHLTFGDKKSYQMNPANIREAIREASLDEAEGADALMVKPALFYLDVIAKMRAHTTLPICAYHVSGEYAMVMAAHERGMLDANKVFAEAFLSIKRAGADFIFSYAVPRLILEPFFTEC